MKDQLFTKVMLLGIFICFMIIAYEMRTDETVQTFIPNVEVNEQGRQIVQLAPNRVGVMDTGSHSGWQQLVVFEYDADTNEFEVVSSLTYEDYFNHPEKYGIPVRSDTYEN